MKYFLQNQRPAESWDSYIYILNKTNTYLSLKKPLFLICFLFDILLQSILGIILFDTSACKTCLAYIFPYFSFLIITRCILAWGDTQIVWKSCPLFALIDIMISKIRIFINPSLEYAQSTTPTNQSNDKFILARN